MRIVISFIDFSITDSCTLLSLVSGNISLTHLSFSSPSSVSTSQTLVSITSGEFSADSLCFSSLRFVSSSLLTYTPHSFPLSFTDSNFTHISLQGASRISPLTLSSSSYPLLLSNCSFSTISSLDGNPTIYSSSSSSQTSRSSSHANVLSSPSLSIINSSFFISSNSLGTKGGAIYFLLPSDSSLSIQNTFAFNSSCNSLCSNEDDIVPSSGGFLYLDCTDSSVTSLSQSSSLSLANLQLLNVSFSINSACRGMDIFILCSLASNQLSSTQFNILSTSSSSNGIVVYSILNDQLVSIDELFAPETESNSSLSSILIVIIILAVLFPLIVICSILFFCTVRSSLAQVEDYSDSE